MMQTNKARRSYSSEDWIPVIKGSICNGDQVAGFKNRKTGKFKIVRYIDSPLAYHQFMEDYGLRNTDIHKVW